MGMGVPFFSAMRSLPAATMEVAMSRTMGCSSPAGKATLKGLVARSGVVLPNGGTMRGPVFMAMPMNPRSAAAMV